MTAPPALRPRLRDVVVTTAAAVAVTALLVGVPILLWWAAGSLHFPTDVEWLHLDHNVQAPSVDEQLRDWLYDTYHALRLSLGADELLVLAVLAVGGLAWLRFVWLTLIELVLLVRDGTELLLDRAQQVGLRGWIASLLTTLALSTPANAADAATAAPSTAATAPPQPATPEHSGETDTTSAATTLGGHTDPPPTRPTTHLPDELRPDCPRYRVHAGDSLTRIAQQHVGDAARWRELADLNQPWLGDPNQLAPGWQLLLPPDAPAPNQPEITEITISYGDTLASLAETHLGTPQRLGELFDLNAGRTQPDGLQLADPNILLAGWKLLVPLDPVTPPVVQESAPTPAPGAIGRPEPPVPEPTSPGAQQHPTAPGTVSTSSSSTLTVTGGGLLALSVASAVAVAMRRHRRARDRTYRPGSGDRRQPPEPGPAVYALRLTADQYPDDDPQTAIASPPGLDPGQLEIGVHEHRTRAVDLATLHGLGITGPGAEACVRALLVHLLAATHATLLIPEQDMRTLLGTELPTSSRLQLAADEHEAAEELAHRTAAAEQTEQHLHTVVVAEARRAPEQLHTLLGDGTSGVTGLLLGPWPTGASLRVRDDGLVTNTDPDLAELRDARLFNLNTPDTRELLTLLAEHPSAHSPGHGDVAELVDDDAEISEPRLTANTSTAEQDATTELATGREQDPVATVEQPSPPDDRPNPPRTRDADVDVGPAQQRSEFLLSLLGPITLTIGDGQEDLAALLAPKHRALLVFLALHPRGTTRAATRDALWPDAGGPRPYNAFYAALSQLRKTLSPQLDRDDEKDLVVQRHEHVALNPQLVDVDYWHLLDAENDLRRASTHQQRTAAWERIITCSHGDLADGLSELWLDAPREHARRTILDALSGLAAHHRDHGDPEQQLQLLERARRISPENEALYRDILRAHAALGQPDAISRTIDLLTTSLANIGQRPESSTLTLARVLQAQQHQTTR